VTAVIPCLASKADALLSSSSSWVKQSESRLMMYLAVSTFSDRSPFATGNQSSMSSASASEGLQNPDTVTKPLALYDSLSFAPKKKQQK